jgi:formamidopyrimidine-DNA glycosylase
MPELPEVEIVRRRVEKLYLGRTIDSASPAADPQLRRPIPAGLTDKLPGTSFTRTHRHGKFLFLDTGKGWLMVHLGMTGRILEGRTGDKEERFARFMVDFDDGGRMTFADPRKFGEIGWTEEPGLFMADRKYGPDAISYDFTEGDFVRLMSGRKALVKPALLNQSLLAGVGNLYADEILFQMCLPPTARLSELPEVRLREMYRVMRQLLELSMELETDFDRFPTDHLLSTRQSDRICPRCGKPLEKARVGGRGTWYCIEQLKGLK